MASDLSEFDRPLFKRLAHNDTGQAAGHQAGVVIPKEMDRYFPQLSAKITEINPTASVTISAALFDGDRFLREVETRYQYQTWGGTRSPERRITGNLSALRDLAEQDDILVIERGISDPTRYRLTLLRQGTPKYAEVLSSAAGRRWGPLSSLDRPVMESEVIAAHGQQQAREQTPFELFDAGAEVLESRVKRIARARAFQKRLLDLYGRRCAICGEAYCRSDGKSEAEAAHIVPRRLKGADDARNGLLLCKSHHWAFDYGLLGIGADRKIVVPNSTLLLPTNQSLSHWLGQPIREPNDPALMPSDIALEWHRLNIVQP